jgi:hypothetical protein
MAAPNGKTLRQAAVRSIRYLTCCSVLAALLIVAVVAALLAIYSTALQFPKASYLQDENTPEMTGPVVLISRGLDGFDSPYLGHTGSWDGQGGGMFGSSKVPDLDREVAMGLRWTFMPVYWKNMEPNAPVDLLEELPAAWQALDNFVIEAQKRRLNILMQAPVIGGNAGCPPPWAGRRDPKRSAPRDMDAVAEFAGKLVNRYRPGGILALQEGWGDAYGVIAWELDNEPGFYLTNWGPQAGDYAEFVAKVAARMKEVHPQSLILTPSMMGGDSAIQWIEEALGLHGLVGSSIYMDRAIPHSIGPWTDVVSFHIYEGLDSFFSSEVQTIDRTMAEVREPFRVWQQQQPEADQKKDWPIWHTEGNFDFLGLSSQESRAAWRFQFFARGFSAGVGKIVVMDASEKEQTAVRTFIEVLPDPFPMAPASRDVEVFDGIVQAFRHVDGDPTGNGRVWVLWAANETNGADVAIPTIHDAVRIHYVDGTSGVVPALSGTVRLTLPGGKEISSPVLLEDRNPL